jgi:hypothetical protein
MRVERRIFPLLFLAGLVVAGIAVMAVQQRVRTRLQYFPQSGHLVRDKFLVMFNNMGGAAMFGYPLTESYVDENGTLVQTFQRAKFQLTMRGVELAPIGRALHLGEPQADVRVGSAFEDFYKQQGGDAFFGLPLSEARTENNLLVQDFERARLIQEADGHIRLADLGAAYLAAYPAPSTDGQAAIRLQGTPTPPPEITASISVEHPTVGKSGEQTLYLFVEDTEGNPVAGAKSLAILRYDAASAELDMPQTNADGIASARFTVPPALPGAQVVVEVHVLSGEIFLTVETTYFQWW